MWMKWRLSSTVCDRAETYVGMAGGEAATRGLGGPAIGIPAIREHRGGEW